MGEDPWPLQPLQLQKAGSTTLQSLHWPLLSVTMTQHHIGALVVIKPGEQNLLAGIVTERDYLQKIIVQGRSSKITRVGEIMTEENKLIAVSSDTKVLQAMELMTDKHIRHVPVIDQKVVGMISIVDVVRAIVEQQHEEVKRMNEFIRGDYY
ncbi:CBS domain-containing protein CBSX3, mitochondrial-like isoform X2 [Typha latifolia]|uniref:CBS domain-containing protein CBSX3, mitochondrial-like isoform X2 n=1 Tax=Typha latifolia TaxID=4733 RepID=UPI003C2CD40D